MIFYTRWKTKRDALALIKEIGSRDNALQCPEAQKELAVLLGHLSYIAKKGDRVLLRYAETALCSLLRECPEVITAKEINHTIKEYRTAPYDRMTPSARVICGLGFCFYTVFAALTTLGSGLTPSGSFFGIDGSMLALAAGCGAIGSIVSIMNRVAEYEAIQTNDRLVYFFIGFFRPFIGSAFAVFVYSTIQAGLLPIALGEGVKEVYFVMALGFISGLSEKFVSDFTGKAGHAFGGRTD